MTRHRYENASESAVKIKVRCGHHEVVRIPPYRVSPGVVGLRKIAQARAKSCTNCRKLQVPGKT